MARILLLESDALLAKTYGEALMQAGHDVMWCITAHQGIVAADHTAPDLVILEPQLAEHGGVEFLYEFRSYPEWDHIPVYVFSRLTADDFKITEGMEVHLGITGYWHKPRMTLKGFEKAVDSALNQLQVPA